MILKNAMKRIFDFKECNEKKAKDVIILIDLNIYNITNEDNLYSKNYKIDSFIEQTQLILNTYLLNNDRFCVLIFTHDYDYKLICPLMKVNQIDINSFLKDLINYKNIIFNENNEEDEFDINRNGLNELNETNNNDDFNIEENNSDEFYSIEDSSKINEKEENNYYDKLNILIKTINYLTKYSKMKEEEKNEKYILIFTDIINLNFKDEEQIEKNMQSLLGDKDIILLLIGKMKNKNLNNEKNKTILNDNYLENLILNKFGEKSEIIEFENLKKIKTILSTNAVIKDVIKYPNEIYK